MKFLFVSLTLALLASATNAQLVEQLVSAVFNQTRAEACRTEIPINTMDGNTRKECTTDADCGSTQDGILFCCPTDQKYSVCKFKAAFSDDHKKQCKGKKSIGTNGKGLIGCTSDEDCKSVNPKALCCQPKNNIYVPYSCSI